MAFEKHMLPMTNALTSHKSQILVLNKSVGYKIKQSKVKQSKTKLN